MSGAEQCERIADVAATPASKNEFEVIASATLSSIGLPAGCVTGVGSLPFTEPDEAVDFVKRWSPVVPFWPQLPRRCPQEDMVTQALGLLVEFLEPSAQPSCWSLRNGHEAAFTAAMTGGSPGLVADSASGFFEFERWLGANQFPAALAIKGQLIGPITLSQCLIKDGTPLTHQPGWLGLIADYLARQAGWQISRLQVAGRPVLLAVDEPCLNPASVGEAVTKMGGLKSETMRDSIRALLESIRSAGAMAGLHCCAQLPIPFLCGLSLDYLSFDGHLLRNGGEIHDLAQQILERGGRFAFGLVPTTRTPSMDEVARLTADWCKLATEMGTMNKIARHSMVTATCGLGLSTPESAAASFLVAGQIARNIEDFGKA
ncbi:MAG: hypothetical protein JWM11_6967 [Planctomycetaceae bacterium]|nr:hypothetical protein [Planctomycetaceae bacterium]